MCGVQEQLVVSSRGYNQETALSRRVKDWEEKIGPELVLQVKPGGTLYLSPASLSKPRLSI